MASFVTSSPIASEAPSQAGAPSTSRRWAELLQRIFEVDPLKCPRCGGQMKFLAFVLDYEVAHAMLKHLRRAGFDPSALPEHIDERETSRAPPIGSLAPSSGGATAPLSSISHPTLGEICA
jgi:hypothetical protein